MFTPFPPPMGSGVDCTHSRFSKNSCIDAWLGKRIWSSVHVCSCVGTQVSLASYLGHLLPVGLGIQRGLREQGGVFLGGDPQLIVEGVVPDLVGRKVR